MLNIVQAMYTFIMHQVSEIGNTVICLPVLIGHFHYISSSNSDKSYLPCLSLSTIGLFMTLMIINSPIAKELIIATQHDRKRESNC